MKKLTVFLGSLAFLVFAFSATVQADLCYICSGGGYVKVSGSDTGDKRKAAKKCGCQVSGTRSSCDAANLKILCSVKNDVTELEKVAKK